MAQPRCILVDLMRSYAAPMIGERRIRGYIQQSPSVGYLSKDLFYKWGIGGVKL